MFKKIFKGYTDEPLSKILTHVEEGEVQKLDRYTILKASIIKPPIEVICSV